MIKNSIYCVISLFLISCSPLHRHTRLVKKYPFVHTSDTIVIHDTMRVEIPSVRHDTVYFHEVFHEQLLDTIVIQKERLKVQIMRVRDSVFIQGECDTIKVEKIVERKIPIKYYETESSWLKWVIICAIAFLVLVSIFRITDKKD